MISFIIVGKNIQNTVKLCLDSVFQFVTTNCLNEYEIIFVDSESKDQTLEIAKQYEIKILLITGNVNSAIARNVGAQIAKGDILFFIDGDMQLFPDFFEFIFNKQTQTLLYPFTNGYMKEKYYDSEFNYLYSKEEKIADKALFEPVTGGLMIVKAKYWKKLNGMDERLIRNQDLDFGFRMAKSGIPVLKDNHFWIIHHTTSYYEKNRVTYFFRSKALLASGLLMRKHIINSTYLKYNKRNVFYTMILLATMILLFIEPILSLLSFMFYISIQIFRTFLIYNKEEYILQSLLYKTIYSIYSLSGFLFYYPKTPIFKLTHIK